MTVEAATYISTLNSLLPPSNDPKSEGDDHIRLIKAVLKSSFPNITGAVTLTQAQLNDVLTKTTGGDQTITAGAVYFSNSAAAGQMILRTTGTTPAAVFRVDATNFYFLLTNNGTPTGSFNGLRPFSINLTLGECSFGTLTHFNNIVMMEGSNELRLVGTNGYYARLRGDAGALCGFVNQAGNAWNLMINDGGNVSCRGTMTAGSGILATDGNVNGGVWGGWLSNYINTQVNNLQSNINGANSNANGRAPISARVQWDSGITETANLGAGTVGDSAPYVVVGTRACGGSSTANCIYLHLAVLRNY